MKNKKLIMIVSFMFIIQLLIFIFINEYTHMSNIFLSPYFLGFVYLVLYFWQKEKIKKKLELTNKYFYLAIIITWTILNIVSFFTLGLLVRFKVLAGTGDFLAGIEYIIMPFFYEIEMIVIFVLDVIWFVIKKIFKI